METPHTERRKYRDNLETGTTSGVCDGYLQANMITLPSKYAFEFLLFCQRNPKPCPIVDVLEAGQVKPRIADADIRTDLPKYRIYKNGELEKETLDLKDIWQEDYVTFLLGCSFTFEKALVERGISLLHQEMGLVVPMYQTNIPCEEAGQFNGNMVVSMRAIRKEELDETIAITSKFPHAHGAPIHVGHPSEIGIQDIEKPDYGEFPPFDEEERVPVFWACGVTPQYVGLNVKPEMMITHAPGHMLITNQKE